MHRRSALGLAAAMLMLGLVASNSAQASTERSIPIPEPGYAVAKSLPYSQSVPALQANVPNGSRIGTWTTTLRLFKGEGWIPIDEWRGPSANHCNDYVWAVRWRSANPDVTVQPGAYAIPDITVAKARPGGAGYIAGSSCNAPQFKFGRAINGNPSTLVDVNVEWRVWSIKPRI